MCTAWLSLIETEEDVQTYSKWFAHTLYWQRKELSNGTPEEPVNL